MQTKPRKTKAIAEFGDFQTPPTLALESTRVLHALGVRPKAILEPTCGKGAFVHAAAMTFPDAEAILGVEINAVYLSEAEQTIRAPGRAIEYTCADFFKHDWDTVLTSARSPWLIIGNPPWVTSAELGALESANLPEKSNFQGRAGIDAITGKSNFDISEWMLLRYLDWLAGSAGTIAILCKTAVARKILQQAWKQKQPIADARIYKIDALTSFGAAVDACFFVLDLKPGALSTTCQVFESLKATHPLQTFGYLDGHIVPDIHAFTMLRTLLGPEERYTWRSGVKHDCSKVMELTPTPDGYRNGLGETVQLEDAILYPMLKSSDLGNGRVQCRGAMVVTQQLVGQDTGYIRTQAPRTWDYLNAHADLLNKRGSVIYKNKPNYSVFGIGPYTFAPWKIAISGFYKSLRFMKVGPVDGRPVVFDDTINFLPCWSKEEADFLESLLHSETAAAFFNSMIHWDEKRPITVDILKRLSIRKLAAELGRTDEYLAFTKPKELPLFDTVRGAA
jgi:methylase of polypeptide subunit release factors